MSFHAFIALAGNAASLTVGVDASCTVAMQCISGLSFGKFFVFNGPILLKDRYDGMKMAFGANREIFTPVRLGEEMGYTPLSIEDYDRLITAADLKQQKRIRLNIWLSNQILFPFWKWSFFKYGLLTTLLYAILAFLPMPAIAVARWWWTRASWIPELAYGALFILVSVYGSMLLDVRRDVCYIRINESGEGGVSSGMGGLWFRLYNRALDEPPTSAFQAVEDLATGRVRKLPNQNQLLVPVMAVRPSIEYDTASAWLSITHLRSPLLTISYFFTQGVDHRWMVAFGIAAFVQASLQNAFAQALVSAASPYEVFWFRRLPTQIYEAEFTPYRTALA